VRCALLAAAALFCFEPALWPETYTGPTVFPEKVGRFTRKEPEFFLGWYRRTGDVVEVPGLGIRPLAPFMDVNATYTGPGGEEITTGVKQFASPADATKALGYLIEQATTPDKKAGPASDLLRLKIVRRPRLASGTELLVMQSLPRYPKAEEVRWADGKNVFVVLVFKTPGIAEEFAKFFTSTPP
jgi:hypothetical protein